MNITSQYDSSNINTGTVDSENIKFEDLFDLDEIQKIQDQFARATGVASIITRPDGTPLTKPSNFCRLCIDIIRNTEKGLANCYKSDAELGRSNPAGPILQPCLSGGLWDGGAGISVGGIHIANWLIGQVRNETQSDEKMMEYAREIGADEDAFRSALAEVRIMSTEQFKEICNALFLFAHQLSQTAYQNFRQERIILERKKAEAELAKAKSYIDNIINSMPSILIGVNSDFEITHWNHKAAEVTGITSKAAGGRKMYELLPQLADEMEDIKVAIRDRRLNKRSKILRKNTSKVIHEDITIYPLVTNGVEGVVIRIDDVTEQCELEQQLAHSRKMDAIGQLAGGIAHDFNNMLGAIISVADMLLGVVDPELKEFVNLIILSVERASELTAKLLAFSRKGKITCSPTDIHLTLQNTTTLLKRSLDKKINILVRLEADQCTVIGDESQMQNAFLNIGINASHAMPGGGELIFTTRNLFLNDVFCASSPFDIRSGDYLEIEIKDTGIGIPPENLEKIFEPFFTTKEIGQGTGLGLAAVYGTVIEHNGAIYVSSEPGKGTTFNIYLPLSSQAAVEAKSDDEVVMGSGRILVVDDEETIRITTKAALEALNYEVITAEDGVEAVEIFRREHETIDLVFLDMIMPKINGRETFEKIKSIDKNARVVMSSGFSKDEDLDDLKQKGLSGFIRKPYRRAEISRIVANALQQKK